MFVVEVMFILILGMFLTHLFIDLIYRLGFLESKHYKAKGEARLFFLVVCGLFLSIIKRQNNDIDRVTFFKILWLGHVQV